MCSHSLKVGIYSLFVIRLFQKEFPRSFPTLDDALRCLRPGNRNMTGFVRLFIIIITIITVDNKRISDENAVSYTGQKQQR